MGEGWGGLNFGIKGGGVLVQHLETRGLLVRVVSQKRGQTVRITQILATFPGKIQVWHFLTKT